MDIEVLGALPVETDATQESVATHYKSTRLWKIVAPLMVALTACGGGESGAVETTNETVPAISPTTTTTVNISTTEAVTTTEAPTTSIPETTTSEAVTEITANINAAYRCKVESDPRELLPGTILDQAGVPDLDKLKFYGNCTGLPGDLEWGWFYPGGPGYPINLDSTGFDYNAKGEHYSELTIGSTDIANVNWDEEHPEYRKNGALTLRELATLEPGTPVCWYLGTQKRFAQNLIFGHVGLTTYYNKYTQLEPKTYIGLFFLKPDGTEDPDVGWAQTMDITQDPNTGAWDTTWIKLGKCVDLPASS